MKVSVHPSNVIIQKTEITCMANKFIFLLLGKYQSTMCFLLQIVPQAYECIALTPRIPCGFQRLMTPTSYEVVTVGDVKMAMRQ